MAPPPLPPVPSATTIQRRLRQANPGTILARLRTVRQRIGPLSAVAGGGGEYAFLVGRAIDEATLRRAERVAREWGVPTHEVLISLGWIGETVYARLLADALGVALLDDVRGRRKPPGANGRWAFVDSRGASPAQLRRRMRTAPPGVTFVVLTRVQSDELRLKGGHHRIVKHATDGLWRAKPVLSAKKGATADQLVHLAIVVGVVIGGALVMPLLTSWIVTALLAVPFVWVVALRIAALIHLLIGKASPPAGERIPDSQLPRYSLLVPLYREAEVVPDLVHALSLIDYPAAKLDILLVLEAVDRETQAAVAALDLPGNVRTVVVPEHGPRTKPKALNYALVLVRTPFLAVYDAEDIPDPDQLRRALAAFALSGPDCACVQAHLAIHNRTQHWLARQFAIEYAVLFDALLPALERLGWPIPLGGTSNHFRVATLRRVGAWDPYNVTEDADLGLRMARLGLHTATISSTTWEEAPVSWGNWMRQRTRWLKGWMQTYIVHTRVTGQLRAELGTWRWFGLHVLLGGILLSVLAHPICLALIVNEALSDRLWQPSTSTLARVLWWMAVVNLAAGYVSAMLLGAVAAWRRRWRSLVPWALMMPVYWLAISVAGYRALYQLVRKPHLWEKTQHGHAKRPQSAANAMTRSR